MLPEPVRQVLRTIDSFEKLEIVHLLARRSDTTWSIARIEQELRLAASDVERAVRELLADRILARIGGGAVRYQPASAEADQAVRALGVLYEQDKLLVVRAMTQLAMDRIRSSAARTFADAFVVRAADKKGPDDA